MSARGLLLGVAIGLVLWLFLWWMVSLTHRSFDPAAVETVATDVSLPKFEAPSTTTTTTLPPATTTTARARTAPTVIAASASRPTPAPVVDGAWSCGGDLPPCWVMNRENPDRDLTAYNSGSHHEVGYTGGNPEGDSTASGKWQFVRDTWAGFMGYVNAADAPWQVQDEKARQLWAGGRGCSHWAAC